MAHGLDVRIRVEGGSFALRRLVIDGGVVAELEQPRELTRDTPFQVRVERSGLAPG
jgi:hypothetical protein